MTIWIQKIALFSTVSEQISAVVALFRADFCLWNFVFSPLTRAEWVLFVDFQAMYSTESAETTLNASETSTRAALIMNSKIIKNYLRICKSLKKCNGRFFLSAQGHPYTAICAFLKFHHRWSLIETKYVPRKYTLRDLEFHIDGRIRWNWPDNRWDNLEYQ